MTRRLAPLTDRLRVGGRPVSFPLAMHATARASVFVGLPRRVAAGLLPDGPFSLVPVAPRVVGAQVSFAEWTRSPVGGFREVSVHLAVYAGTGSPVPGLAPIVHSLFDRTDVVGDYGLLPILTLVDSAEAVELRAELWGVEGHRADLRWQGGPTSLVAQVEHGGDPILRMSATGGRRGGTPPRTHGTPTYGVGADGEPWHDHARAEAAAASRGFKLGSGHVAIYGAGPLVDLAYQLGATSHGGFTRRARICEIASDESVRWAGPRPLITGQAADETAFTGG